MTATKPVTHGNLSTLIAAYIHKHINVKYLREDYAEDSPAVTNAINLKNQVAAKLPSALVREIDAALEGA